MAQAQENPVSGPEYLEFFELSQPPFAQLSARSQIFDSEQYSLLMSHLKAATEAPDCLVLVRGAGGTGKTTLAKIIMGIFRADKVSMNLAGIELDHNTSPLLWEKKVWGKAAGMIFQHADESLNLEANIKETFKGLPLQKSLTTAKLKQKLGRLFEEEITPAF